MAEEAQEETPERRQLKRRRRANVAGGRQHRQHRHEVRVTPEEEALLLQRAAAQRVSVPRLLVEAALAARGETPTERRDAMSTLFGLHRLLAGVANNLNQMTRALHATGEMPAQTPEVLAALRRTAERIDTAIDRLAT